MKLSQDSINNLELLVQTALTGGVKKLIIEPASKDGSTPAKIRGIDDKQQVVIFTSNNVPDLDGHQMAITRLDSLAARIALVKTQGDLNVDATEASNKLDVSILDLAGGKTKAQFRCAAVEVTKGVPRAIADELVWKVSINTKLLPTLNQAVSAMGCETVTIASRDGKTVSFECIDTNRDVFNTEADEPAEWVGQGSAGTSFCHKYPAKPLLTLVKESIKTGAAVELQIGEGGILSLSVNGFDFFVLPDVGSK